MAGTFFPLRKAVKWVNLSAQWGLPGSSAGKEYACNVGKSQWRRAWRPTPVFLPGESPRTEEQLSI